MPRMPLTESKVRALDCRKKPYRVFDGGNGSVTGLHVLVQPTGTRTYHVSLGRNRTMRLGRVEMMTLEAARENALEVYIMLGEGKNPRTKRATKLFKDVVEQWTQYQVHTKERVSAKRNETFVLGACRDWHNRQMASITEDEIVSVLEAKRASGAKHAAVLLYAHLRTLFKWAHKKKLIPTNPARDVESPWQASRARTRRTRDWFKGDAADDVVRALWRYADKVGGIDARFTKLLLITGKRRNAIEDMRWEHIDQQWYWSPPSRSDNKRNNPIPLPKLAQRLLSPRQASGKVVPKVNPARLQKCLRLFAGMPEDFIWHGVRHIVITKLRELRVAPHVAREVTDHVPSSDAHSGYEHADNRDEMLAALERWCSRIEWLVAPAENVAVLR